MSTTTTIYLDTIIELVSRMAKNNISKLEEAQTILTWLDKSNNEAWIDTYLCKFKCERIQAIHEVASINLQTIAADLEGSSMPIMKRNILLVKTNKQFEEAKIVTKNVKKMADKTWYNSCLAELKLDRLREILETAWEELHRTDIIFGKYNHEKSRNNPICFSYAETVTPRPPTAILTDISQGIRNVEHMFKQAKTVYETISRKVDEAEVIISILLRASHQAEKDLDTTNDVLDKIQAIRNIILQTYQI